MDRKRIDPDFIARPELPHSSGPLARISNQGQALSRPEFRSNVPEVFDERRIKIELTRLAGTPGVSKYIAVLKAKFTHTMERRLLEQWEQFYSQATKTVQSHTELVRSQHEHSQLEREYDIRGKEKDLQLTELDATIAETKLRTLRATLAAAELQAAIVEANSPGAQRPALTANDAEMLHQWYFQNRQAILLEQSITEEERVEMLDELLRQYEGHKREIGL